MRSTRGAGVALAVFSAIVVAVVVIVAAVWFRRSIPVHENAAAVPSTVAAASADRYARPVEESIVTINGAPGLLLRHAISGNGACSFDIADDRIRAIHVVRNPDKLQRFLETAH